MLDRILNINPQEKYKSGSKVNASHLYAVNRHDQNKNNSKDSVLFSPLAKLMSKINWRILSIEYPSNDEMLFHFLVDEFEFITAINFTEIYSDSYHEFSIFHAGKSTKKKLEYEIKLKAEKHEISLLEKPIPIKVENISLLFDRVLEMEIQKNYNIIETHILDGLVDGIRHSLNEELNYILTVIYTFISTKHRSRIKNNFILKTQKNIPIIMQKVAIIDTE